MADPIKVANSAAQLDGKTILTAEDGQIVTGAISFQRAPLPPIDVQVGSANVPHLDADLLDGEEGSDYHDASKLDAGTIPAARFPAVLPAASAAALTSIPSEQLTGIIPAEALADPLPAKSHANATAMPTVLPATSLANATHVPLAEGDGQIPSGAVPTATAAFVTASRKISIVMTFFNANGIVDGVYPVPVWPYVTKACHVLAVRGYRVGGTGATVNGRRAGSENFLASNLSLTSADTATDGGAVQNDALAVGEKVEAVIASTAGSPTCIVVQIDVEVD